MPTGLTAADPLAVKVVHGTHGTVVMRQMYVAFKVLCKKFDFDAHGLKIL